MNHKWSYKRKKRQAFSFFEKWKRDTVVVSVADYCTFLFFVQMVVNLPTYVNYSGCFEIYYDPIAYNLWNQYVGPKQNSHAAGVPNG